MLVARFWIDPWLSGRCESFLGEGAKGTHTKKFATLNGAKVVSSTVDTIFIFAKQQSKFDLGGNNVVPELGLSTLF